MDKLIQFCLMVLANLIALAIYGIVTVCIWRAIW